MLAHSTGYAAGREALSYITVIGYDGTYRALGVYQHFICTKGLLGLMG